MQQGTRVIKVILACALSMVLSSPGYARAEKVVIDPSVKSVGRYEKLELLIQVDARYDNPFDPNEVDLTVLLKTPGNEQITLPAFYCQDYERRKLNQGRGSPRDSLRRDNWFYPAGDGVWKARFAPSQTGAYLATARLKDRTGTIQSRSVRFDCTPSDSKGFVQTGTKDPRFLEFTDGTPFFPIGQNLAFVGEGQYVNLTKAEEIFAKLSANGANFARIWTCCEDWAMAIEARKSAWDRSWQSRRAGTPIVPMPGSENKPGSRKCVKIEGDDGASVDVSPSHPVALRPGTRYVLTGRFMADGPVGLRIRMDRDDGKQPFDAAPQGKWKDFRQEFTAGGNDFWLGRMVLSIAGAGVVWLDRLSLKEASGGRNCCGRPTSIAPQGVSITSSTVSSWISSSRPRSITAST